MDLSIDLAALLAANPNACSQLNEELRHLGDEEGYYVLGYYTVGNESLHITAQTANGVEHSIYEMRFATSHLVPHGTITTS